MDEEVLPAIMCKRIRDGVETEFPYASWIQKTYDTTVKYDDPKMDELFGHTVNEPCFYIMADGYEMDKPGLPLSQRRWPLMFWTDKLKKEAFSIKRGDTIIIDGKSFTIKTNDEIKVVINNLELAYELQ